MDGLFDVLALNADEFGVFAAVRAEGNEAKAASCPEEAEAPRDGHAAEFLAGNAVSVLAADSAGGAAVVVVVVSQVDDHGALLLGIGVVCRGRGRGRCVVCGRRSAVSRGCSVSRRCSVWSSVGRWRCVHIYLMEYEIRLFYCLKFPISSIMLK